MFRSKKHTIKFTFSIVLALCCQHLLSAQHVSDRAKYVAFYELTYQYDSTDTNTRRDDTMLLLIGDSLTLFESYTNRVADSIREKMLATNSNLSIQELVNRTIAHSPKTSRFAYKILHWLGTQRFSVADRIFDYYHYDEVVGYSWTLHGDTKQVAGYPCQKATTRFAGRTYTAWFTREIPISAGPYKFEGLPGLIIQLSDAKKEYEFKLTTFKQSDLPISIPEKKYIQTTKKKFLKVHRDFCKSPIAIGEQHGISISNADSVRRRLRKKYNNYIERGED